MTTTTVLCVALLLVAGAAGCYSSLSTKDTAAEEVAIEVLPETLDEEAAADDDGGAADADAAEPAQDLPPDGVVTSGATGDPCAAPTDCTAIPASSKICLTNIGSWFTFPGGYCSASCTAPAECGENGNCISIPYLGSFCVRLCSDDADCRVSEGYGCSEIPYMSDGNTYCLPSLGPSEREMGERPPEREREERPPETIDSFEPADVGEATADASADVAVETAEAGEATADVPLETD